MTAGKHTSKYKLQLPDNLPSTFEHEYGQVRYRLKDVLYRHGNNQSSTKQPVTIVPPLDLNTLP